MAEIITKAKIQLRVNGHENGGRKVAGTGTNSKLLINHGKPNFTIQRSPSRLQQNGEVVATSVIDRIKNNSENNNSINNNSTTSNNNNCSNNNNDNNSHNNHNNNNNSSSGINSYNKTKNVDISLNGNERERLNGNDNGTIFRGSRFNGILKSPNSTIPVRSDPSQPLVNNQNNDKIGINTENEVKRVVLRRTVRPPPPSSSNGNENDQVPEFILRQRRIQERLSKENVLDFEKRRSGYFTQVMISPTSPSRTSFVETMASPAIVPYLEAQIQVKPKNDGNREDAIKVNQPVEIEKEKEVLKVDQTANEQRQEEREEHEEKSSHQKLGEKIDEATINGCAMEEFKMEESVDKSREGKEEVEVRENNIDEQIRDNCNAHVEKKNQNELIICDRNQDEILTQTMSEHQKDQNDQLLNVPPHALDETLKEEEEEVAKAIEEVNKAVAGEEDLINERSSKNQKSQAKRAESITSPAEAGEMVNGNNYANNDATKSPNSDISQTREHNGHELSLNSIEVVPPVVVDISGKSERDPENNQQELVSDQADNGNEMNKVDGDISKLGELKFEIKRDDNENVVVTPCLRQD